MRKKKYKLKCFRCRYEFNDKSEVHRDDLKRPICGECLADIRSAEVAAWEDQEWARNHPGVDREQYEIDEANLRKYGEY